MAGSAQLPLDLGHAPAFLATDFLIADCNAEACGWLDRWPAWPAFALALAGPPGCGKSHLAEVFRQRCGGIRMAASALAEDDLPGLAQAPAVIVEDADQGVDEALLLHLYNLIGEARHHLLLTARQAPARWPVALPDLRSRLASIPVAAIGAPDDRLLEALLLKLFADRQMRIGPEIVSFLVPRMERSFGAARRLVTAIDAAALSGHRPVTVPLVRQVLASGGAGSHGAEELGDG